LRLDLAPPGHPRSDHDLETDSGLLSADYACLTALMGVREATDAAPAVVAEGLRVLAAALGPRPAHEPAGAGPAIGGPAAG
jgi:hypothetical protein